MNEINTPTIKGEHLKFISEFHALLPVVITTNISHFWDYLNSGTA